MEIVTFTKPEPVNPYAKDIADLIAASDKDANATGKFTVPTEDEGKTRYKISSAANALDRTASLVNVEDSKDGKSVSLFYQIKPRRKTGPRARRGGTVANADAV